MSDNPKPHEFDPYREWLGIPPGPRPPSPEVLLGVQPGETDKDLILAAAMRRKEHLDWMMLGEDGDRAAELAKEVANAASLLLERAGAVVGEPVSLAATDVERDEPVNLDEPATLIDSPPTPSDESESEDVSSAVEAGPSGEAPSAGGRAIRFSCSNCTSPVEARRRQAGTKMRCPWCNTVLTVPLESRADTPIETYAVSDGTGAAAAPEVRFKCSVCGTAMSAAVDQAGRKMVCPDCGTAAVVPAPSRQKPAAASRVAPPTADDLYNVLDGQGQPPPTAKEVYGRYIPVVCSLCHTRMLATEEQVGQVMVCPDCGTRNTVPPPSADSKALAPEAMEAYELAGTSKAPTPAQEAAASFTFTCPLCHTRLQAARNQAGQSIICPDCRTMFPIPPPPDEQAQWDAFQEATGIYDLAAPPQKSPAENSPAATSRPVPADRPATVQQRPSTPTRRPPAGRPAPTPEPKPAERPAMAPEPAAPEPRPEPRRARIAKDDRLVPRRARTDLPSWPLVNGVFWFPFYPQSALAWIKFTVGTLIVWGIAILTWPVAAVVAAWTLVLGLTYFVWASKYFLTILNQTANGVDRIEDWSTDDYMEWLFESLFLINSLILSILIGWCVGALTPTLPPGAGAGGAVFLTFPVIILSMLETGSILNPISLAVWGSLLRRWRAWLGFYLLAGLLVASVVGVEHGLQALGGPWMALPASIFTATAMLVYFRLLGRLGWTITVHSRRRARRTEE